MVDGMAEVTQGGRSIATIGRGDLVGEMALLQPSGSGRRNATVTAVTDAEIYAGSPAEFRRHPRGSPPRWPRRCARRSRLGSSWRRRSSPPSSTHDGGADRPRRRVGAAGHCLIGNRSVTVTNVLPSALVRSAPSPAGTPSDGERRSVRRLGRSDPTGDPAAPERGRQAGPRDRRRPARSAVPRSSRHLRLLKDAGLVAERAEGNRRIYHLQDGGVRAVQDYLEGVWGEAAARFRLLAENTRATRRRHDAIRCASASTSTARRSTPSPSGRRRSGPGGRAITR